MKTAFLLGLAAVLATACQKETIPAAPDSVSANPLSNSMLASLPHTNSVKNVLPIDLKQLASSKEKTSFNVFLKSAQGQPLEKGGLLQPNTTYQVIVEGQSPAQFVLKAAESFDIIQSPPASASLKAIYLIKTSTDPSPQLYLSVVPVHREQNVLTKGQPVGFLLPN